MGIKLFTGVWHKLWWPTGHLHLHHSATVWSLGSGVCVGDGTSTSPRRPHSFIFQHTHLCLRVMTARRQQSPLEFLLAGGTFSICVNMQFYCLRKPVLSLAAHKQIEIEMIGSFLHQISESTYSLLCELLRYHCDLVTPGAALWWRTRYLRKPIKKKMIAVAGPGRGVSCGQARDH